MRGIAPVLVVAAACALSAASGAAHAQVGAPADYGWSIRPVGGEETSLERFRGEVLFINLWASWCRPCVAELASIERLRESLADVPEVRFLMISPESERGVRRFLRRRSFDLPFYTEAQRMPGAYGLRALPTTFVVDRAGRLVLVHRGAADWDTDRVRNAIRALAGRPPIRTP